MNDKDELVDVLDETGKPTGSSVLKSEAHRKGLWHPTIHVWCYTADGRILIQQRAAKKDTFPSLWDVSAAGHIGAGEVPIEAALREVEEEIGLALEASDLEYMGTFKESHQHGAHLIDREFHHIFLHQLKHPLSSLQKQDSEVDALAFIPLITFAEETWGLATKGKYVPHQKGYYKEIVTQIKKRL